MIKAVVFDLDDTLVDFMALKRQCVAAAVDAMVNAGLTLPREKAIERIYQLYYKEGLEDQQIFDKFLIQEFGEIDYKLLVAAILAYRTTKSRIAPYPGVGRTLAQLLQSGIKIAIVSDAPRIAVWTRLTEAHLVDFFDPYHIISFDDTNKRKPKPEPFKLALSRLDVKPEEAIMVGDWWERDMVGAHEVGMKTAYVMYCESFPRKSDQELDGVVDHKLFHIKDLLGVVRQ